MKKIISLIMSCMLVIGMVGCGSSKNEFYIIENHIIEKYGYHDNMIEQYEDTRFISIKIPVTGEYLTDDAKKYAEEKQNEIQLEVWNLGYYDIAITVALVNVEDGKIVYVAKADDIYYQRNSYYKYKSKGEY